MEDRAPGSMEARLTDLAKARLFALGAETPHFAWRVRVRTPPGGSDARVAGSAFGRPCEGAVVCVWGGDPNFSRGESWCRHHLEDRVPGSMEARLADLVKARLFAHGAGTPPLRKLQSWAPPASSLRKLHSWPPTGIFVVGNHSHGPHRRLRCPELHSWAPVGVFAVPNYTHGPRKASSLSETAVTGPYVSVVRFAEDDKASESGHFFASPGTTCVARVP